VTTKNRDLREDLMKRKAIYAVCLQVVVFNSAVICLLVTFGTSYERLCRLWLIALMLPMIPFVLTLWYFELVYRATFKQYLPRRVIKTFGDLRQAMKEEHIPEQAYKEDSFKKDIYEGYHLMLRLSGYWVYSLLAIWLMALAALHYFKERML
jgi:hypothetical protein